MKIAQGGGMLYNTPIKCNEDFKNNNEDLKGDNGLLRRSKSQPILSLNNSGTSNISSRIVGASSFNYVKAAVKEHFPPQADRKTIEENSPPRTLVSSPLEEDLTSSKPLIEEAAQDYMITQQDGVESLVINEVGDLSIIDEYDFLQSLSFDMGNIEYHYKCNFINNTIYCILDRFEHTVEKGSYRITYLFDGHRLLQKIEYKDCKELIMPIIYNVFDIINSRELGKYNGGVIFKYNSQYSKENDNKGVLQDGKKTSNEEDFLPEMIQVTKEEQYFVEMDISNEECTSNDSDRGIFFEKVHSLSGYFVGNRQSQIRPLEEDSRNPEEDLLEINKAIEDLDEEINKDNNMNRARASIRPGSSLAELGKKLQELQDTRAMIKLNLKELEKAKNLAYIDALNENNKKWEYDMSSHWVKADDFIGEINKQLNDSDDATTVEQKALLFESASNTESLSV
ncbi:MAG: hypothetical protein AAFO15_01685 [Pseudomonadota bacterium]